MYYKHLKILVFTKKSHNIYLRIYLRNFFSTIKNEYCLYATLNFFSTTYNDYCLYANSIFSTTNNDYTLYAYANSSVQPIMIILYILKFFSTTNNDYTAYSNSSVQPILILLILYLVITRERSKSVKEILYKKDVIVYYIIYQIFVS